MPNGKGGSNSSSNSQSEIDVIHYALVAPLPRLGRCKYLSKKYTPAERIIDTALILQGAVAICISDCNLDIICYLKIVTPAFSAESASSNLLGIFEICRQIQPSNTVLILRFILNVFMMGLERLHADQAPNEQAVISIGPTSAMQPRHFTAQAPWLCSILFLWKRVAASQAFHDPLSVALQTTLHTGAKPVVRTGC